MQIYLISDREVTVKFGAKFKDSDRVWKTDYEIKFSGSANEIIAITAVGRKIADIEYMWLQYDKEVFQILPDILPSGDLRPIRVAGEGRHHWNEILRQAALRA